MNTTKVVGFPRFYRFHDHVAVNPPSGSGGQTFYLSQAEARAIGQWLVRAADDIDAAKFTDSTLLEFGISDQASELSRPSQPIREQRAELIAALKLLLADVQDYEAWQRPCHAVDVARATLAKVEPS